jgi:hypothetical protein
MLALIAWWAFIAFRMVRSAKQDSGPTGLPGDLPNWHNRPGELSSFLGLTLIELAVILAILRPRSYAHSWRRALAAVAVVTPWLVVFVAMMIHAGGVMVLHVLWLGGLWIGIAVLAVISGAMSLARAHKLGQRPI